MLLDDPHDRRADDEGEAPEATPRRPIVVQKYGGSSVADTDKLGKVADRIVATRRAGHDVVAVVSAMGKTTDQLLGLAEQVASAGDAAVPPPRRELDMLVSTGERVAMSLLSIAIRARGEHAISFTGSQCGIITNDRHFDARIIEVRPHRIEDELARGRIVIVAGYQGMSYRREITTLGRGGSDTTAVALAAALEAERCEIYSDVDGVYSADPRAVPDARHLPELDYDTLQQMAECGAKVLCAGAVEFARRAGIAIYARSTFEAVSDTPKQTVIRRHGPASEPRARAVSCDRNLALVRCGSDGALSAVLEVMQRHELSVAELMHGQDGAAVLIPLLSAPDWPAGRAALLALTGVGPLELVENVASVSLVAGGLAARPDAVARFAEVLVAAGAPARTVLASALRITALIERDRVDDAQRALHAVFC